MNTKLQIIETPDYILGVSDDKIEKYYLDDTGTVREAVTWDKEYWSVREDYKKIIAYQPKGNAPKLNLPLLPEMVVEDDVEKLINKQISDFTYDLRESTSTYVKQNCEGAIFGLNRLKESYKAATKFFSEDDLRKAFQAGEKFGCLPFSIDKSIVTEDEFIQSIKQPKWFVAETTTMNKGYSDNSDCPYQECEVLKTTTINDKIYLIGKYLNE